MRRQAFQTKAVSKLNMQVAFNEPLQVERFQSVPHGNIVEVVVTHQLSCSLPLFIGAVPFPLKGSTQHLTSCFPFSFGQPEQLLLNQGLLLLIPVGVPKTNRKKVIS